MLGIATLRCLLPYTPRAASIIRPNWSHRRLHFPKRTGCHRFRRLEFAGPPADAFGDHTNSAHDRRRRIGMISRRSRGRVRKCCSDRGGVNALLAGPDGLSPLDTTTLSLVNGVATYSLFSGDYSNNPVLSPFISARPLGPAPRLVRDWSGQADSAH